jgi:glycosyltransferase involved in cell wall biosynthesis
MEHIYLDVAIPNYNSPFLAETLDAVLQQELGSFSLNVYVVDDGSQAIDLAKVQKTYEAKGIKFYQNEHNLGLVGNFNRCLALATQPYLHILHADDLVDNTYYKTLANILLKEPDIALVACHSRTYDGNQYTSLSPTDYQINGIFEHLKFRNCLVASAVIIKTDVAKAIQFRNYAPHTADWDMWARITANHPSFYATQTLHTYREHASNDTANYNDLAILTADALLLENLIKDGVFTPADKAIGKAGLVYSAKYRVARLVANGHLVAAFSVGLFIWKNGGFSNVIALKLGVLRVLLSKLKKKLT